MVNCVPDFGRSFISYTSGGFRASRPGSDNQLLDRDLRKADLHPSTGPCPLTTRFDSGHFLIRRSDLEGAVLCHVDDLGSHYLATGTAHLPTPLTHAPLLSPPPPPTHTPTT